MIRKLLALGAAGVVAAMTVLPAAAFYGYGCGYGCGLGYSLAGWWGPILGCPWGLFGGPFCW